MITTITYSLPNGKIKSKDFTYVELVREFKIRLRLNKCKIVSIVVK